MTGVILVSNLMPRLISLERSFASVTRGITWATSTLSERWREGEGGSGREREGEGGRGREREKEGGRER